MNNKTYTDAPLARYDCYYPDDFGSTHTAMSQRHRDGAWYSAEDVDARIQALEDENAELRTKLASLVSWLEANQPDVFRRGIWDAVTAQGEGGRGMSTPPQTGAQLPPAELAIAIFAEVGRLYDRLRASDEARLTAVAQRDELQSIVDAVAKMPCVNPKDYDWYDNPNETCGQCPPCLSRKVNAAQSDLRSEP